MPKQVDVQDLTVTFSKADQFLKVLEDVSFHIKQGEVLALLGESGCGKSVMALALMRLLPHYARYGMHSQVQLNGVSLLDLTERHMRAMRGRKISMVFQEPMTALNPVLTIYTQLSEVFLRHESLTKQALEERLIEALQEVELSDPLLKLSEYPHQLSGGEKQRVVIAMALASHPDLLIADEPTTALDVTIQAQILDLLKKLQKRRLMSVLFITHDLGIVKRIANRVCVMYAGEIVELAQIDDFFKNLKNPYVQQLLVSLPSFQKRGTILDSIPGFVPALDDLPKGCRFHPRCAYAFERCEREKPALLPWKSGAVRCHLYEQHESLHDLQSKPIPISKSLHQTENVMLLSANHLSVSFVTHSHLLRKNEVLRAVEDVSLSVRAGETLAIVGESGSGKTTLSRALLGLYPLNQGEIYFKEQPLSGFNRKAWRSYRKAVQVVFQDPFASLDPRMTVYEILSEGMRVQKRAKQEILQKIKTLLDQVGLPETSLTRYPHEFSGGQRQRISIARALSTDPELLICDEPTSALDISVQAQILNLFKTIQSIRGLAYIFITHNMGVVSYLADEVIVMKAGRIVEQGTAEAILFHAKAAYTQQLVASVLT